MTSYEGMNYEKPSILAVIRPVLSPAKLLRFVKLYYSEITEVKQ